MTSRYDGLYATLRKTPHGIRSKQLAADDIQPLRDQVRQRVSATLMNVFCALFQFAHETHNMAIFSSWLHLLACGSEQSGGPNGDCDQHIDHACDGHRDRLIATKLWLFPLCGGTPLHWVLGWIDTVAHQLYLFDSCPKLGSKEWALPALVTAGQRVYEGLGDPQKDMAFWTLTEHSPPDGHCQTDAWSCAFFVFQAIRIVATGADLSTVTADNIDETRLQVLSLLVHHVQVLADFQLPVINRAITGAGVATRASSKRALQQHSGNAPQQPEKKRRIENDREPSPDCSDGDASNRQPSPDKSDESGWEDPEYSAEPRTRRYPKTNEKRTGKLLERQLNLLKEQTVERVGEIELIETAIERGLDQPHDPVYRVKMKEMIFRQRPIVERVLRQQYGFEANPDRAILGEFYAAEREAKERRAQIVDALTAKLLQLRKDGILPANEDAPHQQHPRRTFSKSPLGPVCRGCWQNLGDRKRRLEHEHSCQPAKDNEARRKSVIDRVLQPSPTPNKCRECRMDFSYDTSRDHRACKFHEKFCVPYGKGKR
ncbi:hypothetical protein FB45DRAFT_1060865 [Roridomyces roridus]|uniref:Ubiquitin-like protease family profile domain-containing protein n=1 Tax=Roridomyces roridus TaxID=1738132 RepID=A0AAD7FKP5_9AGAR|nr:hypothetical protein FB45DRAFT_1060865 [Roridomyces roridus]